MGKKKKKVRSGELDIGSAKKKEKDDRRIGVDKGNEGGKESKKVVKRNKKVKKSKKIKGGKTLVKKVKRIIKQIFLQGVKSVFLSLVLGVTFWGIFFSGFFIGQWRLEKENYCFSPTEVALPLRRIFGNVLGTDFTRDWSGRAVVGKLARVDLNEIEIEAEYGLRVYMLTDQTRYFIGSRPAKKVEFLAGDEVGVLLSEDKKTVMGVIRLDSR